MPEARVCPVSPFGQPCSGEGYDYACCSILRDLARMTHATSPRTCRGERKETSDGR